MASVYNPSQVEQKWYTYWEENDYFHQEVRTEAEAFSIVMPPPNVTGSLHLGHAMDNTLQDILTRFKRMQGLNTLWLPGTDHAGIATQAKVEEQLALEGKSKHDLGRAGFLERVWSWKAQYGGQITRQLRRLGASCDWRYERFTMDEGCSRAVREVFVQLYRKQLIYRGNYIINWCPKCLTTISDIEVEHEEREGQLFYLRYPVKDSEEYITVATTRPETMLGDTAVAVHPQDERYAHLIGKTLILPLIGREIPILADDYVDKDFGTGAVKITPAHDPNDYEMGLRHDLTAITVLDQEARLNENAGVYQGMERYEARRRIIEDLKERGLWLKTEDHRHAVGECYRCSTVIEPRISRQWFVKMKPLAEPAMQVVREGRIEFSPERFSKIYLTWLENIRDWCISRQLWWGHRIPVWYCQDCGAEICAQEDPDRCPSCASARLEQDPDVLDTWFSSGLWPFSTLGWPEKTPELQQFYPTSVLVTGRDIIFFWVARMIFMALEFQKEPPFRKVMIHGLILDSLGRKMSKSLGNGVDPLEVIDQYGADALRFMLVTGNTPGNDVRFHPERLEAARNFANKIWNASRFVILNVQDMEDDGQPSLSAETLPLEDRWILSRFSAACQEITRGLENYDLGEAGRWLYEFIWNEFCDWYIELAKIRLYDKEQPTAKKGAQAVLLKVLEGTLRLLHPFMPFISEEIWSHLPGRRTSLMLESWPREDCRDQTSEKEMAILMEVVKAIRNIRAEMHIAPGKKTDIIVRAADGETQRVLEKGARAITHLAGGATLEVQRELANKPVQAASAVLPLAEIYLPLKGLLDIEKEIARMEKDLAQMRQEEQRLSGKLDNESFIGKAPAEVVAKEKKKMEDVRSRQEALQARLEQLRE
ncbi:MAG: valine--tRNA ligase [Peptococcaceae bacterium]|nr:valine--tRNA ligase [Peptococcaceae bacterium]